ncbi:PAC2 family protein [Gordonia jinhuaensis]
MVAAFEGWNDAADAASGAVEHLALTWDSVPLVDLDSDDYYDFQVNRPTIKQIDGVTRRIEWPTTSLSHCRPPGAERDIVLLRGIEPNMRWRGFCQDIIDVVTELGVRSVVILGALLADAPHTRPVPVTGAAYSAESARTFNLEESRYEGPTGITGVLQDMLVRAGIPAVSFWAAVPHYVSSPPNPKASVALLGRVEEFLDIEVPLGDMPDQADEWERTVTEMTEDDEEVAEYVRGLEERGDAETNLEAMSKIDGDALAAEFERYLRRRGRGSFG